MFHVDEGRVAHENGDAKRDDIHHDAQGRVHVGREDLAVDAAKGKGAVLRRPKARDGQLFADGRWISLKPVLERPTRSAWREMSIAPGPPPRGLRHGG